jgi:hypothetical protein
MQISIGQPPAGCKFHSVGRHVDVNFIQSAVSRMQASDQPNEICILLVASRMQILQK